MNHHRVIQVLNQLLPTIKEAGSPKPVMLKYAQDNNLSPAQLEKMGQVFNTAKTLTFLDRSPDRGASFDLLDVPELVSEYSQWEPQAKAASAPVPEHNPLRFPGMKPMTRLLDEDLEKAASDKQIEELSQWEKQARRKALDRIQLELEDAEEEWTQKQAQARKWARQQDALADIDPQDAALDLVFNLGERLGKTACRWVWDLDPDVTQEQANEKRAWDTGVAQDRVRLEALDRAVELIEGAQRVAELRKSAMFLGRSPRPPQDEEVEAEWVDNEGLSADDFVNVDRGEWYTPKGERFRPDYEASYTTSEKPKPGERGKELDAAADKARQIRLQDEQDRDRETKRDRESFDRMTRGVDQVLTPVDKLMTGVIDASGVKDKYRALTAPPTQNRAQQSLDTERLDTERSLVLARLMQSDPIISEADPDTVQELYNSLQEVSPEYVRDPARLRMALREAVEYGAVPIHTLNELAQYRKTLAEARGREGDIEDREYRI